MLEDMKLNILLIQYQKPKREVEALSNNTHIKFAFKEN